MPHAHTSRSTRTGRLPAFTLVELLIVVAIISTLVGIATVVGAKVIGGGKVKTTREILMTLDQAFTEYTNATGGKTLDPMVRIVTGAGAAGEKYIPMIDGVDQAGVPIPSLGLFLKRVEGVEAADKVLKNIPSKFVRLVTINGVQYTSVLDAWGKPIRFVHPALDGLLQDSQASGGANPMMPRRLVEIVDLPAEMTTGSKIDANYLQVRRNAVAVRDTAGNTVPTEPDSDGGTCQSGRAYFYSVGPDGKAGTIRLNSSTGAVFADLNEDNVYLATPQFQQ